MASQSGFTIVELVLVMVLLGILAASLWPRAPTASSLTLQARADQLASDIRYAQTLSMTRGQRYCLTLTATSYSLTNTDPVTNNCTTAEAHPGGLAQPISLCANACLSFPALTSSLIQFNGLGTPYINPTTTLNSTATITFSEDGNSRSIVIAPVTGRVLVQ
jgi:MSHA pilin protein MshC